MPHRNQNGITLIEVLLSIVILTIILVSIMNFFPQMGLMNNQNEEKQLAVNIAKKELLSWQNAITTTYTYEQFIKNPSHFAQFKNSCESTPDFYCQIFDASTDSEIFDVRVKIKKDPDLSAESQQNRVHQLHIQVIKDENERTVSETFGYIIIEG